MTDRRTFIRAIGGGLLAVSLMAETQQPQTKVARIGFLGFGSPSGWGLKRVEVLRAALRDLATRRARTLSLSSGGLMETPIACLAWQRSSFVSRWTSS